MKHIKDIDKIDRPREKLAAKGAEALSDFKVACPESVKELYITISIKPENRFSGLGIK